MANTNFEDYGFKPSAVIEGLNQWYEHGGFKFFNIEFPESKEGDRKYHVFRTNPEAAIDDAIKYLRSFDIFYTPDMKWDDVKFELNSRACLAEYGFGTVHDALPKVDPAIDQIKLRDSEIRDYILKQAEAAGIKLYIGYESPEDLIYYLISLLVRNRNDAKLERERADGYLEKINRLQKELDKWNCWYNDKEQYVK